MKRKSLLIVLFFCAAVMMFIPIFSITYYDTEADIQNTFEKYKNIYPDRDVSVLYYRQTTGGLSWEIRESTNNDLCGPVLPIWLINPNFVKDNSYFKENSFLFRGFIVISSKSIRPIQIYYDYEKVKIFLPQKIIVCEDSNVNKGDTYRLYDLSLIGFIMLVIKIMFIIVIICITYKAMIMAYKKIKRLSISRGGSVAQTV